MFSIIKKTPDYTQPFKDFFNQCAPKMFVSFFRYEHPQTIAYILSFCKNAKYLKKVVKLYQEEKKEYTAKIIVQFLEKHNDYFNRNITLLIEKYCTQLLEQYFNGCYDEYFRKRIKLNVKIDEFIDKDPDTEKIAKKAIPSYTEFMENVNKRIDEIYNRKEKDANKLTENEIENLINGVDTSKLEKLTLKKDNKKQ